jgi:hypothetical protein
MKQPTDEQFDNALAVIIDEDNPRAANLLSIPGIYEILSEYYNNDVLDYLASEQEESEDEEE